MALAVYVKAESHWRAFIDDYQSLDILMPGPLTDAAADPAAYVDIVVLHTAWFGQVPRVLARMSIGEIKRRGTFVKRTFDLYNVTASGNDPRDAVFRLDATVMGCEEGAEDECITPYVLGWAAYLKPIIQESPSPSSL